MPSFKPRAQSDVGYRAHVAHTMLGKLDTKQVLATVFFSRDEDKNVSIVDLMAALTRQIVQRSSHIPGVVLQTFRQYQTNSTRRLDMRDVETMLSGGFQRYDTVYLVADALDECPSQSRLDLLRELSKLQRTQPQLQLLMSSRDMEVIDEDIAGAFHDVLQIKLVASNTDLRAFIQARFEGQSSFREARRHHGLVEELERTLTVKAQGM